MKKIIFASLSGGHVDESGKSAQIRIPYTLSRTLVKALFWSVNFFVANLDVKFSSFNSTFQRHHADVEAKLASF